MVIKPRHYHKVGVPFYFLIDQKREKKPRHLKAYEYTLDGYVEMSRDGRGRVLLGPTGILLGLENGRAVCYDAASGQELGDYTRVCRELEQEVAATFGQAESFGTWANGLGQAADAMFEDVYAALPAHLQRQRDELHGNVDVHPKEEPSILSFAEASQRAAG